MDLELRGKNALVYASSKGLGYSVALELAKESCNVAICSRNSERLEKARQSIQQQCPGVKVIARTVDLENEEEVLNLIDWTIQAFKQLDILVTNAGGPPTKPLVEISSKEWDTAIAGILKSVVLAFNKVIPHMISNGGGRIITLTSLTVKQPFVNFALSNTLRAGISGLIKTAANEHAKDSILINNVCPGYTNTERVQDIVEASAKRRNVSEKEIIEEIVGQIPVKRLASVEEIASVVAFLASARASYITGQTIAVDGGYSQGLL
ncbi:MAG: SDR family oxidoreductase [Candidatus Odinarchaeota archaeon]